MKKINLLFVLIFFLPSLVLAWGDGVRDDTAEINSAIRSAYNNGTRLVFLPAGIYKTNTGIDYLPGVKIQGVQGATWIVAGADNITLLSYRTYSDSYYFQVDGVGFDGNGHSGVTGIYFAGEKEGRIIHIDMDNLDMNNLSQAIRLRYGTVAKLNSLRIRFCSYGIVLDQTGDININNAFITNGDNAGLFIQGDSRPYAEGIRLNQVVTNGQYIGIIIKDHHWGIATGCSFTTCPGGALRAIGNSSGWKFNACEFSVAGPEPISNPGVVVEPGGSFFQFIGCLVSINTYGMALWGNNHTVSGCAFNANRNVDLNITTTDSVYTGNTIYSWSPYGIFEQAGGDYNIISSNIVANGVINQSGQNSLFNGNLRR